MNQDNMIDHGGRISSQVTNDPVGYWPNYDPAMSCTHMMLKPPTRYVGVSVNGATPKWLVSFMENPMNMDDLRVPHGTPIYGPPQIAPWMGNISQYDRFYEKKHWILGIMFEYSYWIIILWIISLVHSPLSFRAMWVTDPEFLSESDPFGPGGSIPREGWAQLATPWARGQAIHGGPAENRDKPNG